MAMKENSVFEKECRGRCMQCWRCVSIRRVQDLPERNTAEDEGL